MVGFPTIFYVCEDEGAGLSVVKRLAGIKSVFH